MKTLFACLLVWIGVTWFFISQSWSNVSSIAGVYISSIGICCAKAFFFFIHLKLASKIIFEMFSDSIINCIKKKGCKLSKGGLKLVKVMLSLCQRFLFSWQIMQISVSLLRTANHIALYKQLYNGQSKSCSQQPIRALQTPVEFYLTSA